MQTNQNSEQEKIEKPERRITLDFSIKSCEERMAIVEKVLKNTKKISEAYLDLLCDYIIESIPKEERKNKKILTNNRKITVDKRETSFEGLAFRLKAGEDGIYDMMCDNKNIFLSPKNKVTAKDLKEIPELNSLNQSIEEVKRIEQAATGKRKYGLKKQIIEMYRDLYVIKDEIKKPISATKSIYNFGVIEYNEDVKVNPDGTIEYNDKQINFFNPKHISKILCMYSDLKELAWGNFEKDIFYMMEDLDVIVEKTLNPKYPLFYDILIYKIDGLTNSEIQTKIFKKHQQKLTPEYISNVWRNKIPKLIADKAVEEYVNWYYTYVEYGNWKKCNRCGQIKLRINRYFSKNITAKDGFYSICKECRNKKTQELKIKNQ